MNLATIVRATICLCTLALTVAAGAEPWLDFQAQGSGPCSDGKLAGGLRIDQPERFWEPSKFLIIVKS